MKASHRWIRELVPSLMASPKELADRLTFGGIEVEGLTEYGVATESCVVAQVVSTRPHPQRSGLRLVTVDRGSAKQELVCGAPNVPDPGGLVVLAPLGTFLPAKNLTIAKRAIGGVESEGMLCSEDELGLGDDHDGILVLPKDAAAPGTPLSRALPSARDTVFEINLTANRPDALGHVGLAREIAALFGLPFTLPEAGLLSGFADVTTQSLVEIVVEDAERCPHYGAAAAIDVTIRPSPAAIRYRLQALGVRAISNIVDVTNLVMLEYGHPMHAFDLERVRGRRIVVRRAREGERLTTLDGVERTLASDDLLVCDGEGPVALAGIMGGASSEITKDTKRVLFECAWFDPRGVRRAARRHGMHTESSHRFERGVDPGDVAAVLDRAVRMTCSFAGGMAAKERLHVQGSTKGAAPAPPERRSVTLRARRVRELLGVDIPFSESVGILTRLGCEIASTSGGDGSASVVVPTHRPDLSGEVDLIEEIIRVHGMDAVPAELPRIRASRDVGGGEELTRRAREAAVTLGLSEAMTYGFTSRAVLTALSAPPPSVVLRNPLTEHQAVMRTSLLPGLLDALKNARRHGELDVRQFTIGPVFLPPAEGSNSNDLPRERLTMAVVLAGNRPSWLQKPQTLDVWDAKGYASELARGLSGVEVTVAGVGREQVPSHLHPRGAGSVHVGGEQVGTFGLLHPEVVEALELDGDALVIELDLEPFRAGRALPAYTPLPRFPSSTRDVALVVKDDTLAGDVERVVRAAALPLAEDVRLFDRFTGGQVPAGHTSLAFRVVYRAPDRTLTDAEVDAAHEKVIKEASLRFGATLRG